MVVNITNSGIRELGKGVAKRQKVIAPNSKEEDAGNFRCFVDSMPEFPESKLLSATIDFTNYHIFVSSSYWEDGSKKNYLKRKLFTDANPAIDPDLWVAQFGKWMREVGLEFKGGISWPLAEIMKDVARLTACGCSDCFRMCNTHGCWLCKHVNRYMQTFEPP